MIQNAKRHSLAAMLIGKIACKLRRVPWLGWAMVVTMLGWTMMWAEALQIVVIFPLAWAVALFALGLASICMQPRSVLRKALARRSAVDGGTTAAPTAPDGLDHSEIEKEAMRMRGSSLTASVAFVLISTILLSSHALAANCPATYEQLTQALRKSVKPSGGPGNGGLDNNEWAALVARDGTVCAVSFSGAKADDQWPGSRGVAAEKANTANAFSLKSFALSTANLYAGAQPAGTLYGMQIADPVAADLLHAGDAAQFGTASDPMLGKHLGGVIAFGGGLALYSENDVVGAVGVSGDSSCADHNVAWRVRQALGLDHVPAGVTPDHNDGIVYDILPDKTSASGYGHITCKGTEAQIAEQIHAGLVPQWAKPTQ